MKTRIVNPFRGTLLLGAALFCMGTATAGDSPPANGNAGWYYHLNGERVALSAVAGEVLVQQAATATRNTVAASFSVAANSVTSTGLPGWSRVKSGAVGANNARSAVASFSQAGTTAFVSPVLTTASGGRLAPTSAILVKYKAGTNPAAVLAALKNPALVSQAQLGTTGIWQIITTLRDGFAVLELANRLHESGKFEFATADFIQSAMADLIPSDPQFLLAWGLRNVGQSVNGRAGLAGFDMGAAAAWDVTRGSSSVKVLVMDTGAQLNHPDLRVQYGQDFTGMGGGGGPVDANDNHGTAVAGCIAALHNGVGTTGIAPNVQIASAKIAGVDGDGFFINYRDSNVVNALSWGRGLGARISNSSWGGGAASAAVESAFQSTRAAGMVHFASSGNRNNSVVGWPSSSPHVISVGATANNGTRASFSSYGTDLDFVAPGEAIVTCDRTGSAGYGSGDVVMINGTSFSSPYAAGVAALLLSREPGLTPDQVLGRMRSTCVDMGTPGRDNLTGWGQLNAARLLGVNPPPPPTDDHGNTIATATTVSLPATVNATLNYANDIDMFRLVLDTAATLRVYSTGSIDMVGRLYNAGGTQLAYSDDEAGNRQFIIATNVGAGTYYLAASGYSSAVTGSYGLRFEATAAVPAMRVTGTGVTIADGDTTPGSADATLFGQVTAAGGVARSTFTISNTGGAALLLNGTPVVSISGNGAVAFRVASLPATSISAGGGTATAIEFAPAASGTFTATVTIRNNTTATSPYDFVIQGTASIPVDAEGNTRATAKSVYRISNTAARLDYSGDVDYFKFTLPGTRTVVAESIGNLDTYGYIEDANGRILGQDDDNGAGNNFRVQLNNLPAGTYYVRVRGYSGSTTGSYTLSIH